MYMAFYLASYVNLYLVTVVHMYVTLYLSELDGCQRYSIITKPGLICSIFYLHIMLNKLQYLLCSILCPQLLHLCHSLYIIFSFLITKLAQLGSRVLFFNFYLPCQDTLLLFLTYYAQYYMLLRRRVPHFIPSCGFITTYITEDFIKTVLKSCLLCQYYA